MAMVLQACNPLGLCAGSLPSWCAGLPEEFPSLFSLDVRLSLLKKTAFGMARGVAHVQARNFIVLIRCFSKPRRCCVRTSARHVVHGGYYILYCYSYWYSRHISMLQEVL